LKNLSGAALKGRLRALPTNNRLGWKGLLGTNTLAYYGRKKPYDVGTWSPPWGPHVTVAAVDMSSSVSTYTVVGFPFPADLMRPDPEVTRSTPTLSILSTLFTRCYCLQWVAANSSSLFCFLTLVGKKSKKFRSRGAGVGWAYRKGTCGTGMPAATLHFFWHKIVWQPSPFFSDEKMLATSTPTSSRDETAKVPPDEKEKKKKKTVKIWQDSLGELFPQDCLQSVAS